MTRIDPDIEKAIEAIIIMSDAESALSFIKTEKDPIVLMSVIPYMVLFVKECQNTIGDIPIHENFLKLINNIRNYIKVFSEGFGKTKKRVSKIDRIQDAEFCSLLRFKFMRTWNVHYNIGTYWTDDKHVIGNTHMYADFLGIDNIKDDNTGIRLKEFCSQISGFIYSIEAEIGKFITIPAVERKECNIKVKYYCDLNTNKINKFFIVPSKELFLLYLNLLCNINYLIYILIPMFDESNMWVFRVEYVVTYYVYTALKNVENHIDNNDDIALDGTKLNTVLKEGSGLFNSDFRNCMMHYGLHNRNVLFAENIDKPMFGMVANCFEDEDFEKYREKLKSLENSIATYLEGYFNRDAIRLREL